MSVIPGTHLEDVSEFQNMDWPAYFKVRDAAIIRADYGIWHQDNQWVQNHPARTVAGLSKCTGIYQYLVAGQDAAQQANAFCDMVGSLGPNEFYILDLEEGEGDQTPRAQAWFAVCDSRLGVKGNRRFVWDAGYGWEPGMQHDLWQHTDGTEANHDCQPAYPGAPACDCSVYHGNITQLVQLVNACNSCIYSYIPFIQAHIDETKLAPAGGAQPPIQPTGVQPMHQPITVTNAVAELASPKGGYWQLTSDGAVFSWLGAVYHGGANGQPYFAGRTADQLVLPNQTEAAAGKSYVIIAASGERYAF